MVTGPVTVKQEVKMSVPREPWHDAYRKEARLIVSATHWEWKQHWAASEYLSGKRDEWRDMAIAMRALMLARGEIEASSYNKIYQEILLHR